MPENTENVGSSENTNKPEKIERPVMTAKVLPPYLLKRSAEALDKENINPASLMAQGERLWDDLDSAELGDPMMAAEYAPEIFEYMRHLEKAVIPRPNYNLPKRGISWASRTVLVDWLVDVQNRLRLLPETLFLTVNIIDRILAVLDVQVFQLQLLGLVATSLASKCEEVVSPSVTNFVHLSEDGYSPQDMLSAERRVLYLLGFSLAFPSPMNYLRRISKAENYDLRTRTLAKFLMEITFLDHCYVSVPPSLMAAASMFTARLMLRCGPWNANLAHYSGYTETELRRYSNRILLFLQSEQHLCSIHRKYASKRFMKASVFVFDWIKRHFPTCASVNSGNFAAATYDADSE